MNALTGETIEVAGLATRLLQAGPKDAPACVLLHGAIPGVTPYCGGAHLWGEKILRLFEAERRLVVPDLPGSGGTALGTGKPTIDAMAAHVRALLDKLDLRRVHLVGHDLGGLVALLLAMDMPDRLVTVSVVASGISAPLGDSLDDIVFLNPPEPAWSRLSQEWALDRISHSRLALDDGLLDACVAAASGAPHRAALAAMAEGHAKSFQPSATRTKFRLWDVARSQGLQVPVQLVWGSHDPTTSRERGLVLFDTLAEKQKAAHFHLINRAGNLVFRDQPDAFHQVVAAFQDGVMAGRN